MRYILNELRMIVSSRKLMVCFLLFLVMNIGILTLYFDTGDIDAAEYTDIKNEMLKQPEYIYDVYSGDPEEETQQELYDEYMAYTDYDMYLDAVFEDAEAHASIAIFQSKFSQNNLRQTKKDFARLVGTKLQFVGGYGLCKAVNFAGSYLLMAFLMMVLVLELVIRDKKNGLTGLYKTTRHGDFRLILSKYIAGAVYMSLYIVLASACDLGISIWKFGAVDMSAPIQSLSAYTGYGYKCTIGGFVALVCLSKILIFLLVMAIAFLCAVLASNEVMCCAWTGVALFMEFVLQLTAKRLQINVMRRMSVLEMLDTESFFSYLNYDMAGQAVSALLTDVVCICVFIALVLAGVSIAYGMSTGDYREGVPWLKARRKTGVKRAPTSMWYLEGCKLWLGYKMIWVVVLLAALQIYIYQNKAVYWSTDENAYRYYMEQIAGDITQDKLDYVAAERARYDEIQRQMDELDRKVAAGEISESVYSSEYENLSKGQASEGGFIKCEEYVQYIIDKCGITDSVSDGDQDAVREMGFVYSRGWNKLAGGTGYKDDMQNAAKLVLVLMLVSAFLYLEDYRYRINAILDITEGYGRLCVIKALRLLAVTVFAYVMVYLPDIVWTVRNIGLTGAGYRADSLMDLSNMGLHLRIRGYFCLVYGIRLVTVLFMTALYVLVGRVIKNTGGAIFLAAVVVLLPILLYLCGITGAGQYPLVKLLSANMLLRR